MWTIKQVKLCFTKIFSSKELGKLPSGDKLWEEETRQFLYGSDSDGKTLAELSGLLDSTVKISMKYYTDDGTTKGSGETTIEIFRMSDFRHHENVDGSVTAIVYPTNIQYRLSGATLDYADIKYITFGLSQPT